MAATVAKVLAWIVFWPVLVTYYALANDTIRGSLWGVIKFTLKWSVFFCLVLPFYVIMFLFACGVRATTGS